MQVELTEAERVLKMGTRQRLSGTTYQNKNFYVTDFSGLGIFFSALQIDKICKFTYSSTSFTKCFRRVHHQYFDFKNEL